MCGLAGYINWNGSFLTSEQESNFLTSAKRMLSRRGPDAFGSKSMTFSKTKLCFAHSRLSIIDLSNAANQPFLSEDENQCMVFNGEIYNYKELKEVLPKKDWRTNSDTEVLLEAFRHFGIKMFDHLEGMFAGAIYDRTTETVLLFRDHLGIKPLYFTSNANGILFGSEPKVIRSIFPHTNQFNSKQASTFVLFGISDYSNETFFNDIHQLEPGETKEIDLKSFKQVKGNMFKSNADKTSDFEASPKGYRKLFLSALSRQLRSDVQVGTSLSGGIDSGIIATGIGQILKEKAKHIKALTYVAKGFEFDESKQAKLIAKNSRLNWTPVEFNDDDFLSEFDDLVKYMEEPFGSLSIYSQFSIMKQAKENGCKVMLDGQGGDELYLGYPRLAQRIILQYLMEGKVFSAIREWKWAVSRQSMPVFYPILSNIYFNSYQLVKAKKVKKFKRYFNQNFLNSFDKDAVSDFFSIKGIQSKQVDEFHKYVLPRLLRYADRNSMYHSVESRVPHLAQRLVNFSLNLPPKLKVKNGWTKYIVRKSFENEMPEEVIWQTKKIGFDTPQSKWLLQLLPRIEKEFEPLNEIINLKHLVEDIKNPNLVESHELFRVISFGFSILNLSKPLN